MKRQLVFVHGRAQEQKDSVALKAEWLDAFADGLAKSNLTLPIPEPDVRFPFYGDALYDLTQGRSSGEAAGVILRGTSGDDGEKRFVGAIVEEIRQRAGITDAQVAETAGQVVIEKGPLNWEWTQAILRTFDRYIPFASGNSIALVTHDVYQYLTNSAIRETIDAGVSHAFGSGLETVVVAHSLGTIVAYNLLRQQGTMRRWNVPLFVTLGSPLAVTEIRKTVRNLSPPTRCPECVKSWINAMDGRDVVALYPLDPQSFPLDPTEPAIKNKCDVRNKTSNRHGIAGYLDDQEVAKWIHAALTG